MLWCKESHEKMRSWVVLQGFQTCSSAFGTTANHDENHESVISPGSCEPHKITPSVHGVMMHDCPQWGMHGESCSLHPPSVLRLFYFVCESTDRRAAVTVQLESLWFCFGALWALLHPVPLWWFVQLCLTRGHSAWLALLRFTDHRPESVTVQSVGVCLRGLFHESIHSDNCGVHSLLNFLDVVAVL